MRLEAWFLLASERGNPDTELDAGNGSQCAWTEGNHVEVLVHGAVYFARLASALSGLGPGDEVRFTDWRSDGDELVGDQGPSIATLLAEVCRRGADVRGLLWRSHSDRIALSAKENRRLALEVTEAGGEVLLDERVRRGGSHHQKLVVVRHRASSGDDVAFVGGIDLCHSRRDDGRHLGDAQSIKLDQRFGPKPPWHDVQLEIHGPAVAALDCTFRERWEDPTPLNHAGRARALISPVLSRDRVARPLPPVLDAPPAAGSHAVQVLRTYPSKSPGYRFARAGERSVARGFAKAIDRARSLIYLEDQYFWSTEIAHLLADALGRQPRLRLIVVVPRYPDKDSRMSGPPSRLAQARAMSVVQAAGGGRVGFYDLENEVGTPVYVHAKACVIDDVWAAVGSDNLNRRSWTHDSELSCAVIDGDLDLREPRDPGGLGDGSRQFARQLRISLWAEHLGMSPEDPELLDLDRSGALWDRCCGELASWKVSPGSRPRPSGRVRAHDVAPVPRSDRWWAETSYRVIFDPDGRPTRLRMKRSF